MVECKECVYNRSCCQTLKECRSYGGGKVDPQYIIKRQREEIEKLKEEKMQFEERLRLTEEKISKLECALKAPHL